MLSLAIGPVDTNNDLYRVSVRPFTLEKEGEFVQALEAYKLAIEVLNTAIQKFKKSSEVRKIVRKMFERQVQVHQDRLAYLESLQRKGDFVDIVNLPTILDAMDELKAEGEQRTLSCDRKDLFEYSRSKDKQTPAPDPSRVRFLSLSLPSTPPIVYRISHDSELVAVGTRSHWFFVKDATNTHLLYAFQAVWSNSAPIVDAVLRRAGELLPSMGAVSVRIRKTPTGSFGLETSTVPDMGTIPGVPDAANKRKTWSPRRFHYGGRSFVWKNDDERRFLKAFTWETLYETKRAALDGDNQPDKMGDEIVGERLCWGQKKASDGADYSIFIVDGLDMCFREHLLASQLARMVRVRYPPHKDNSGVEAVEAGMSLVGFIQAVAS
ncbi:hypothetical protein ARAM_002346 [Aspergillus rambellii]|uniref:MIT domain-containing protein n=1 Tax=Aspergillus rambellii TaxID=308745 RepID=A0A0F8VMZ5_9EURO|nr:hypothetical protein ARAM_002346 [Aspergillus rambellii]